MNKQWPQLPLTRLVNDIVDNRGRTAPTAETGIPLIATNCISNDALFPKYEKVRYVSHETYRTWFRGHPQPGDIIFVNKGTPGLVCLVPDPVDFCIAQDMVALRADQHVVDGQYLFAVLRSPLIQERIADLHVGTLIPHVKKGDFGKLLIPVPPMEVQVEIGRVHTDFCRKIDLNRRMNATLEATARALFKSWFVDFDPVRAKMEGRQPDGMDADTAALFPDRLVESELGLLPEGWRVGCLGDIATNPRRSVQPQSLSSGTLYIGLEHMPQRSISLADWGMATDVESNKYRFFQGEILFGKLRPYFHKVGIAPADGICSTDILVVSPTDDDWWGYVLMVISDIAFIDHATLVSGGTRMPRVTWQDMARYEIVIPETGAARAFNEFVQPIGRLLVENIYQSRTLAAARDTLLPKLLSGEVRVEYGQ